MPQGIGYENNPQGLESILQALSLGGQPTGNIANLPPPTAVQQQPGAGVPPTGGAASLPDPVQQLLAANPGQAEIILEALAAAGVFNAAPTAG